MKIGHWDTTEWVSLSPNGIGRQKPNHYLDMLRVAWRNRSSLPYARRILTEGVCDGCALGTAGLHDWTIDGVHLCTVRLNLLELNTAPALDTAHLRDARTLENLSGADLRALGRLPHPMRRRQGEAGFTRVSWDAALAALAARIRRSDPDRVALYLTSRGITNEVYYAAQKAWRGIGSPHVDNAARVCHSPSTTALNRAIGVGATTCSYTDLFDTDLVVLWGADVANNQPVMMKYLYMAKKRGAQVVVVNPFREPGLEHYWVPSNMESALFGTKIADHWFPVTTGGDVAFANGVLKALLDDDVVDHSFVDAHTDGFDDLAMHVRSLDWGDLERSAGVSRNDMRRFARLYGSSERAIFVWSMGLTQHTFGHHNVSAVADLALVRGMVGRDGCGLMPIRGHSGVQGGAEMGAYATTLPGPIPVTAEHAGRLSDAWGFPVPAVTGHGGVEMLRAAEDDALDVLWSSGGNFLDVLPDPARVRTALERVPVRVHQDIVLSSQMLVPAGEEVWLLPAMTRYESPGGGTETTTERRIIFSPEVAGPRIGEARPEWSIFGDLARHVRDDDLASFVGAQEIRDEIARIVPTYAGIETLRGTGDAVQWGGRHLCSNGEFPTPSGKATLVPVPLPEPGVPDGMFRCSTRRGKQFNSMVQGEVDPLTGARRHDALMNPDDVAALELADGEEIVLTSPHGRFEGRVRSARMAPGNVAVFWPEGNILLGGDAVDEAGGVPDYNAPVEITPLRQRTGRR